MGEWSPFTLSEFEWEVLKLYIKYGYGDVKLYNTSFFTSSLTDDTVCMALNEFAEKAVDFEGVLWKQEDEQALKQMGEESFPTHENYSAIWLDKAIDIVKAGGING